MDVWTGDQLKAHAEQREAEVDFDRDAFVSTKDQPSWAALGGWWVWHDYDPRRNREGLPDRLCIRPPVLKWVELKTERGYQAYMRGATKTSRAQRDVIQMLQQCTVVEAGVYRPADRDRLMAELLAGSPYAIQD